MSANPIDRLVDRVSGIRQIAAKMSRIRCAVAAKATGDLPAAPLLHLPTQNNHSALRLAARIWFPILFATPTRCTYDPHRALQPLNPTPCPAQLAPLRTYAAAQGWMRDDAH